MPIFEEDNENDGFPSTLVEKVHQTQPHVVSPTNITPIVDTRYEPLSSLIQYVDGTNWQVDYFSQLVTQTSEASSQQPNQHPVYQQYINIKNLEIRVTTPIAYSQDSTSNESILIGSSTLYPGIIANEGDMFVADVGDGQMGVFTVNEVVKKSQMLETCYEINYAFTGYAENKRQLLADLLVKTVKTDYFIKELLGTATKPFLAEREVFTLSLLKRYTSELVGMYFGSFFNRNFRTFLVPENMMPIYDPFSIKALTKVLDVDDHPLMTQLKVFNIDDVQNITDTTIWSIILDNQIDLMPLVSQQMWKIGPSFFNSWPLIGSIYHSGLDAVVYPLGRTPDCYGTDVVGGNPLYPVVPVDPVTIPPIDIIADPVADVDGTLLIPPYINSVVTHDRYVLSPAFYNQLPQGQSILELLLSNYLAGRPFNALYLIDIFKDIKNWRPLDKFYQIPVLIILLKVASRRF